MKTIKIFALILVLILFAKNTGKAQDQNSEGDWVWTDFTIDAECLPETITGDFYCHWSVINNIYRETAYGIFTGSGGAGYYCEYSYSGRFRATHETGGIMHGQWTTWLRKEGENNPAAKLHIMWHQTWANDEPTASIDKYDVICMGK